MQRIILWFALLKFTSVKCTPDHTSSLASHLGVPWVKSKTISVCGGGEKPKKKADHSRLVDGMFNKQGNLHTRLVLGSHKMSRSLHPPAKSYQFL